MVAAANHPLCGGAVAMEPKKLEEPNDERDLHANMHRFKVPLGTPRKLMHEHG